MAKQHHNYEYGESFGFINNAFAEPENFPHNPENEATKANIQSIMPHHSNSPAMTDFHNQSSPYDLTSESIESAKKAFHEKKPEESQSDANIQSLTTVDIEGTAQNEDSNKKVQEGIENSENISQDTEKGTEENATSDQNNEEITPESSECINDESQQKVVESKSLRRDISGKKRRRIVILNDDDSDDEDENELKKELLDRSSDVEQDDKQTEKSNELDADNESDSDDEKELAATNNNRNFLKAKYLLKTAVIIEDPDKKKKKKKQRVLDSDDDDQIHTSVDDIGLLGNENENEPEEEGELFTDDIVIINNDPIVAPEENPEELGTSTENAEKNPELDKKEDVSDQIEEVKQPADENLDKTEDKDGNEEQKSPKPENPDKPNDKNEEDDVNAELDKIQPMDDDE